MVEIERSSVCDLVFMDVYWEWHMPLLSPHQLASLVTFQEKKKKDAMDSKLAFETRMWGDEIKKNLHFVLYGKYYSGIF